MVTGRGILKRLYFLRPVYNCRVSLW